MARYASLRSLALLPVLAVLSTTLLQGGTRLQWKLEKGQELEHITEMKTTNVTKLGAMDMKVNQSMKIESVWKVKTVSSEGLAEILQTTKRIQLRMEQPMQGVQEYDSSAGKKVEGPTGDALNPILDAMAKGTVTFELSSQGEVTNVRLDENFKKALDSNPAAAQMGGTFSEDGMKQMVESGLPTLPAEDIERGKTWDSSTEVELPFGKISVANKYTYDGPATRKGRQLEKILVKSTMNFKKKEGAPVQMKFNKMEASGEAWFDTTKGRYVEVEQKQQLVMEVQAPGGGAMDSTTETTSTVKISDKASE
jgi:hypothetical protein